MCLQCFVGCCIRRGLLHPPWTTSAVGYGSLIHACLPQSSLQRSCTDARSDFGPGPGSTVGSGVWDPWRPMGLGSGALGGLGLGSTGGGRLGSRELWGGLGRLGLEL
eukprot:5389967-Prymnesium_polylepis.1